MHVLWESMTKMSCPQEPQVCSSRPQAAFLHPQPQPPSPRLPSGALRCDMGVSQKENEMKSAHGVLLTPLDKCAYAMSLAVLLETASPLCTNESLSEFLHKSNLFVKSSKVSLGTQLT